MGVGYSTCEAPSKCLSYKIIATKDGLIFSKAETTEPPFLPVSCGAPPAVTKAATKYDYPRRVYGEKAEYECEIGYSTDKTPDEGSLGFFLDCEANGDYSKVP